MPPDLSARLNEVRVLLKEGKKDQAHSLLQRMVRQHPEHPGVNQLMCLNLATRLEYPQALYFAQRAVAAEPKSPELLINLANCLAFCDRRREAIDEYLRVLDQRADHPGAIDGLAHAYIEERETSEALKWLTRLIEINPRNARAARSLAGVLLSMGRQEEAVAVLRSGLEHNADNTELASGLCSTLNYLDSADPRIVFEAHTRFGAIIERVARPVGSSPAVLAAAPQRPARDPERRLRIGFISADLRAHSCAWFAEPLIRHLDRARISIVVYFGHLEPDAVTARFKALADVWRDTARLSDEELAALVRRDSIDILIDLHGHTSGQRFPTLARRPAPVQVNWLGYPNTTGLRAVGYRLVDSITDPLGAADGLAVERLVRLDPCFLCYGPPSDAPDPAPPPSTTGISGRISLGSFNALQKLTARTVSLWARAARRLEARLVLKHLDMGDERTQAEVARRFVDAGLAPDRITYLQPTKGLREHLSAYNEVDIALETFPYHGTTTTCEALWMGVPVVTRAGEVHASRVGSSLLTNVGVPELIAHTDDQFVSIVESLACDRTRLAGLRSSLRDRMRRSPLCDAPGFARRFGETLRALWRESCAQPDAPG